MNMSWGWRKCDLVSPLMTFAEWRMKWLRKQVSPTISTETRKGQGMIGTSNFATGTQIYHYGNQKLSAARPMLNPTVIADHFEKLGKLLTDSGLDCGSHLWQCCR